MRCNHCKIKFDVKFFNQKYCLQNDNCIKAHVEFCKSKQGKSKLAKIKKSNLSEIKASLLTHKEYLQLLQKVFNTYIRMRDKGKPCISCNKPITGKTDAGHFYSVGGYPALRFNEDNVHSQCINCNQFNHGNIHEYTINLPKRIGQERFDYLVSIRESVMKYSIDELKEMLKIYKLKIKQLNNNFLY